MRRQIQFGTKTITFSLLYQERKSLGIKVLPDATVMVHAPVGTKESAVLVKVKSKAPWIIKQLGYFNNFRPATPPRRYLNGETHLYLGRQYKLRKIFDTENVIKVYRGQMLIHTINTEITSIERQLNKWYRERAQIVFDEIMIDTLPKFKRFKLSKPSFTIRRMTKRWGSCTQQGHIVLNQELIKAPKGCIEYVITHELCHLVHHSHTKEFFNLQTRMLPDWKKWKDRLEYLLV